MTAVLAVVATALCRRGVAVARRQSGAATIGAKHPINNPHHKLQRLASIKRIRAIASVGRLHTRVLFQEFAEGTHHRRHDFRHRVKFDGLAKIIEASVHAVGSGELFTASWSFLKSATVSGFLVISALRASRPASTESCVRILTFSFSVALWFSRAQAVARRASSFGSVSSSWSTLMVSRSID